MLAKCNTVNSVGGYVEYFWIADTAGHSHGQSHLSEQLLGIHFISIHHESQLCPRSPSFWPKNPLPFPCGDGAALSESGNKSPFSRSGPSSVTGEGSNSCMEMTDRASKSSGFIVARVTQREASKKKKKKEKVCSARRNTGKKKIKSQLVKS